MPPLPAYKYQAISRDGEKVSGVIEGFNELDAVRRIKETCDVVLKVTEVKEGRESFLSMEIGGNRLDSKAFAVMCSQFAIILRSGISIGRAVHLVADKTTSKPLQKVLKRVAEDVEAGRSLAESFAENGKKLFPTIFIETIRAGEASGSVDRSFQSMYEHYDKASKVQNRVKGAMAYPLFVLALAVVVVIVLMSFVVPKFTAMFEELGGQLPFITRLLIGISHFFQHYVFLLVFILAGAILVWKIYTCTDRGKLLRAKLALSLPLLGNIQRLTAASQFANGMASMLSAGIPMNKAVSITAKTMSNYYISKEIGKISGKLENGRSLGESLREADVLPDILTDMTAVGEETGAMEETLSTVAEYYDTELNTTIDAALKKLEPALLVILAVVAGFIVIAMYMAMFSVYNAM